MVRRLAGAHALLLAVWVCGTCLTSAAGADDALRLKDAAGTVVELPHPARRIVSLAPHVSELLFEIGAGDRLVGAVEFSDYPPAATRVPRIGDNQNLDLERLLALRPELIVGWWSGNRPQAIEKLRALGLPVYLSEPRRLQQIAPLMRTLGRLSDHSDSAEVVASAFERRLAELRARFAQRTPVRVFLQVWDQPLMTLNGEHLVSDVVALCGGVNVFASLGQLAPSVPPEAVLAADPEVIVVAEPDQGREDGLAQWRRWPRLRAVEQGQLYRIDPDLLQRPTSRILRGAEHLCRLLDQARSRIGGSTSQ